MAGAPPLLFGVPPYSPAELGETVRLLRDSRLKPYPPLLFNAKQSLLAAFLEGGTTMKALAPILGTAIIAAAAAASAAQPTYQPDPNQPGYDYPEYPGTQSQGDAVAQNVIGGVIDALIGNRYNMSDRQAIKWCSYAAVQQAENQYRPYYRNSPFAYPNFQGHVRVTAITDVNRRSRGVRVKGLLDTARYGYGNGRRGADLSFRCDVDYRGRVYNMQLQQNPYWRG
jgi:hypothetical protein